MTPVLRGSGWRRPCGLPGRSCRRVGTPRAPPPAAAGDQVRGGGRSWPRSGGSWPKRPSSARCRRARVAETRRRVVAHLQHDTVGPCHPDGLDGLAVGHGERLLDEDVLAGFGSRGDLLQVDRVRGGQHEGVDGVVGEEVREARGAPAPWAPANDARASSLRAKQEATRAAPERWTAWASWSSHHPRPTEARFRGGVAVGAAWGSGMTGSPNRRRAVVGPDRVARYV